MSTEHATPTAQPWKRCTEEMPDSDTTVMIYHPEVAEPVWLGYHDGETWRDVCGLRAAVSHWMHLPEGQNESSSATRQSGASATKEQ
jgi:hypothetical protein